MDPIKKLVAAAREVRERAYAPYSKYLVGAAVRSESGAVFAGCNVENASYGLTICAERNALAAMIAAGGSRWTEIAVVTEDEGTPCGACRQVMAEFAAPAARIHLFSARTGEISSYSIGELLPDAFTLQSRRSIECADTSE
ncbi:MAG: Cytidine deaminase [Fimbriimonadaceae bacterium]|nr:Cytidine deaminase [Fimbriimonadaceae bacterium]